MSVLSNARHERYAQELAKGQTQEQAYKAAGYNGNRHHASALGTKKHIKERVAELLTRNVQKQDEKVEITTERLLMMAEEARQKAMAERGGAAAAVTALTAIAKLSGRWIEKSEVLNKGDDLNTLTDAELAAIIKQGQPADNSKLN